MERRSRLNLTLSLSKGEVLSKAQSGSSSFIASTLPAR